LTNDTRLTQLIQWLNDIAGLSEFSIEPASADASFRRYFRVVTTEASYIAMDAPPERENSQPFVEISSVFTKAGLCVPEVLQQDLQQGFLLLTDLGKVDYLSALNKDNVDRLYGDALSALVVIQTCTDKHYHFPSYSESLLNSEIQLFREWLLEKHLGLVLMPEDNDGVDRVAHLLIENAIQQPQVTVHRDYHSRNLMMFSAHNPGILDFQDAVRGPVTYDLVSLLRDCYIQWPREQIESWVKGYHDLAVQSGILRDENEGQFLRWFDLMGVQRHLKAAGIFARLNHRDGKPGYLKDIPRTLGYIEDVCLRYPELAPLQMLFKEKVMPVMKESMHGNES